MKYPFERYLVCLNPHVMANDSSFCTETFLKLLRIILDAKQLKEDQCDRLVTFFNELLHRIHQTRRAFEIFDKQNGRLDHLRNEHNVIHISSALESASNSMLSPNQSWTNEEIIVKYQKKESLIDRRIVKDKIIAVGGMENVVIKKEMMNYA